MITNSVLGLENIFESEITNSVLCLGLEIIFVAQINKLSSGFRKYFCNSEIIFVTQITNLVLCLGLENNFESWDSNSVLGLGLENIFVTQITNSANLHRFVNCEFNSKFKNSKFKN